MYDRDACIRSPPLIIHRQFQRISCLRMAYEGFDLRGPYHFLQLLVVYILTLLDERRDRCTENRDIVSDRFEDIMLEDIPNDFDYIRNLSCRDPEFWLKEIQSMSIGRRPVAQRQAPGGGTWSGYVSRVHLRRQQ